jgi:hypothetical protein
VSSLGAKKPVTPTHELVLTNGERRPVTLPAHTGSIGNVLSRLDDWIKTDDGGWVQKSFVLEVRLMGHGSDTPEGSVEETRSPSEDSAKLAEQERS